MGGLFIIEIFFFFFPLFILGIYGALLKHILSNPKPTIKTWIPVFVISFGFNLIWQIVAIFIGVGAALGGFSQYNPLQFYIVLPIYPWILFSKVTSNFQLLNISTASGLLKSNLLFTSFCLFIIFLIDSAKRRKVNKWLFVAVSFMVAELFLFFSST